YGGEVLLWLAGGQRPAHEQAVVVVDGGVGDVGQAVGAQAAGKGFQPVGVHRASAQLGVAQAGVGQGVAVAADQGQHVFRRAILQRDKSLRREAACFLEQVGKAACRGFGGE